MLISDWSSDVCSSDLSQPPGYGGAVLDRHRKTGRQIDDDALNFVARQRQIGGQQIQPREAAENLWRRCNRSEEHTSELPSLMRSSYAVFCLKKKKYNNSQLTHTL